MQEEEWGAALVALVGRDHAKDDDFKCVIAIVDWACVHRASIARPCDCPNVCAILCRAGALEVGFRRPPPNA